MAITVDDVLKYWYETLTPEDWWRKSDEIDADIRARFLDLYRQAVAGGLNDWADDPDGVLALVIVLDQFPRNMFRDTGDMYASDEQAIVIARKAVECGLDKQIPKDRRLFLYLPFEHSEKLADQDLCCDLVATLGDDQLLEFAEAHRRIVRRFGRFPHRNALLGRVSTAEETAFLKEDGSSF